MITYFEKVKNHLLDLGYNIVSEDFNEELVIVENDNIGIKNLILDCEDSVLIIELLLFEAKTDSMAMYKDFLQLNRHIIHGAIALDEEGSRLIFRDTLELENLDLNELQATLNSLELFLSENAQKLIEYAK